MLWKDICNNNAKSFVLWRVDTSVATCLYIGSIVCDNLAISPGLSLFTCPFLTDPRPDIIDPATKCLYLKRLYSITNTFLYFGFPAFINSNALSASSNLNFSTKHLIPCNLAN